MDSDRSYWSIRLAILGFALTGFVALTASSEPRGLTLEEAQPKATTLAKETGARRQAAARAQVSPALRLAAVAPRSAAATGTIQCQCAQWSESSFWIATVCTDNRCWDRGPRQGECQCYKWEKINYEQQYCQSWTPNFCNFQ